MLPRSGYGKQRLAEANAVEMRSLQGRQDRHQRLFRFRCLCCIKGLVFAGLVGYAATLQLLRKPPFT
jgi:hypothetical protein